MAIVTAADVQTMLGLGSDDLGGRLTGLLEAASAMAEEYLNRWITEKEYTQVCSGGGPALVLKAYPMKYGTVISFEGAIVSGVVLDNEKGLLYREDGRTWPSMPGGYHVTYTGGLSEVPAPIKQAIALLVAALNNTVENKGQQVASERLSDYQVSYARPVDAAGLETLSVAAAALLRPYRSRPW